MSLIPEMSETKRRLLSEYIKTAGGRRKLSEAMSESLHRREGPRWRLLGVEHLVVARLLEIDYERVKYIPGPMGPYIRIQGMTHRQFMRWAPKVHKRTGLSLAHRERKQP